MAQPILVAGSYKHSGYIALIVFSILFASLTVIGLIVPWPDQVLMVMLGLTISCAVGMTLVRLRLAKQRRFITPLEDGFHVREFDREQTYTVEQVTDIANKVTKYLSNGVVLGFTREATLWVEEGEETHAIAIHHFTKLNETDPLDELFTKIFASLTKRVREDIQRGAKLIGDGWILDASGLAYSLGNETVLIGYDEIASASPIDGNVCLWRKGEAAPSYKIGLGTLNAPLLGILLTEKLSERKEENLEEVGDGLGRIIFERDTSISQGGMILLVAFSIVCSIAWIFSVIAAVNGAIGFIVPIILFSVLILCWAIVYKGRLNILRCHNLGVRYITSRKTLQMKYADVEQFTWSATRNYHNGVYTGTTMILHFTPFADRELEPISYTTMIKGNDDEIDNLRDFISEVIAQRMLNDLRSGQSVQWTPNLRFVPEGIEYRPSGTFGRKKETKLIPFAELYHYQIDQGWLHLFRTGQQKSVVQESVGQPNFFPGFFLLTFLLNPPPMKPEGSEGVPQANEEASQAEG